jgi:hypothetical protein
VRRLSRVADLVETQVLPMTDPTPEPGDPHQGRRRYPRVAGPFEGRRIDRTFTTPVFINDLGLGGCLVRAEHEQRPGRQFVLEIDLPGEGSVRVHAEVLYTRESYGFAARFVSMTDDARERLHRAIQALLPH